MGFAELVLPDENNNSRYRNINSLVCYTLANGKTYIKESKIRSKVHYCDSNCVDISEPRKAVYQIKAVKKF